MPERRPDKRAPAASLACLMLSMLLAACGGPAEDTAQTVADTTNADPMRLAHLQELAAVIGSWHAENRQLPRTLIDLGTVTGMSASLIEALERRDYNYEVLGNEDYTLCAHFAGPNSRLESTDFWHHGSGEHCYRLSPAYGQY